jgi:hypothetical protein
MGTALTLLGDEEADWAAVRALEYERVVQRYRAEPTSGRLPAALAWMGRQPRTETNLDTAERILRHVAATARDREEAVQAAYQLARLAHVHRRGPIDAGAAAALYEAIVRDHADHPLAANAAVHRLGLALYAGPEGSSEERLRQAEQWWALIPVGAEPRAVASLILAHGYLRHDGDRARALALLDDALVRGLQSAPLTADVLTSALVLAHELGRDEAVRRYRERMQTEFPRDPRHYELGRQLAVAPVEVVR